MPYQVLGERRGLKSGLSYEFAGKPPQKRDILIVRDEFGKIVCIEREE